MFFLFQMKKYFIFDEGIICMKNYLLLNLKVLLLVRKTDIVWKNDKKMRLYISNAFIIKLFNINYI